VAENEWRIAKGSHQCQACAKAFAPAEAYYSVLRQSADTLARQDYCTDCFQHKRPDDVYYFWKTAVPDAGRVERKRPPLDVECVLEFLRKLEGDPASQRVAFRFILALMLTRKKVLVSDGARDGPAGPRVLRFREKGGGHVHEVVEPQMSSEELAAVSNELGVLLGLRAPPAVTPAAADKPA
jgi:hypothetical protein